jgi:hypothetical protein
MGALLKSLGAEFKLSGAFARSCVVFLLYLGALPQAHAGATLLLEEPYSYDGAFAGTGHSAVYLSHVCSDSPIILRLCREDESGVVLSRYDGVAGYDWIAVPLISYLYAVEQKDSIPLYADAKLIAFLRDQYRRDHFETLAPDRADGGTPEGNWYELVGASYDRTIYGFEIETSPEQDVLLITKLNRQQNRERYNFVKQNCADFVREVIDFYYPHALHRSVIGDLGVTTPKQIAKMMVKYSRRHRELESSNFVLSQVPGAGGRSKPVHGVLESLVAAKKYMVPLAVVHPYIGVGLLVGYMGHHFNPAKNAPIVASSSGASSSGDSSSELDSPVSHRDRLIYESRLKELSESSPGAEAKDWERLQAEAQPELDDFGQPVLEIRRGDDVVRVGVTRSNILESSGSRSLAAEMLETRIRQELRPSIASKTAHQDVESDLELLRQLVSKPRFANTSNQSQVPNSLVWSAVRSQ